MSSSFTQFVRVPYLKTQWKFPSDEIDNLVPQVEQAYVDIANKVNSRTIGIFAENTQVVTGERWYLSGYTKPLQTLRKLYVFGSIPKNTTSSQPTGITNLVYFTRIDGTALETNGTTWVPIQFATSASPNATISVYVEDIAGVQNVTIHSGNTAQDLTSAYIVLEWISDV